MDLFEFRNFDTPEGALTPEGVEFVLYPAGPLIRSIAYGIDLLIQSTIVIIISIALGLLKDVLGIWLYLILIFLIDWFYHVICELSFRGQSVGKRIMGIRVVRSDGAPVDPASSFLRNLLRFADTFFFLYHIVFISMISSAGFRRLGDWAGGTLVVYTPKSLALPRRLSAEWLADLEPLNPPRPLSYEEKRAILMFARRYPLLGAARANEIAASYTGSLCAGSPEHAEPAGDSKENTADAALLLGIARKLSGIPEPADTGKETQP